MRVIGSTTGQATPDTWHCDLGTAIVHRACVDYLMVLRGKKQNSKSTIGNLAEIEQFFTGRWFAYLCDADGEALLSELRRKNAAGVKTIYYGKYSNDREE